MAAVCAESSGLTSTSHPSSNMLPNNSMNFTENQHGNFVLERLRCQRDGLSFCDVQLLVDGELFEAHRCVLAAASLFFDRLFRQQQQRRVKQQLSISCGGHSIFGCLLDYIYSGNVVVDKYNVNELVRLANHFDVIKLKRHCCEYLERYLSAVNCISVLDTAAKYQMHDLYRTAVAFARVHADTVLRQSEAMELAATRVEQLLICPDLQLLAERQLLFVLDWVRYGVVAREHELRQLLLSVPLQQLDAAFMTQLLRSHQLFAESERCLYLFLQSLSDAGVRLESGYDQIYNQLDERFMSENDLVDNDTFLSMAITTAIEELEGTEAAVIDGLHRLQQQASASCSLAQTVPPPIETYSVAAVEGEDESAINGPALGLASYSTALPPTSPRDLRCHSSLPPQQLVASGGSDLLQHDQSLDVSTAPLSLVARTDHQLMPAVGSAIDAHLKFSRQSPQQAAACCNTDIHSSGGVYPTRAKTAAITLDDIAHHEARHFRNISPDGPPGEVNSNTNICSAIGAAAGQDMPDHIVEFMEYNGASGGGDCYSSATVDNGLVIHNLSTEASANVGVVNERGVPGMDIVSGANFEQQNLSETTRHQQECIKNESTLLMPRDGYSQPESSLMQPPPGYISSYTRLEVNAISGGSAGYQHQPLHANDVSNGAGPVLSAATAVEDANLKIDSNRDMTRSFCPVRSCSNQLPAMLASEQSGNINGQPTQLAPSNISGDHLPALLSSVSDSAAAVVDSEKALMTATTEMADTQAVTDCGNSILNLETPVESSPSSLSPPQQQLSLVPSMPAKKRKLDPLLAELFRENNIEPMSNVDASASSTAACSGNYNFKKRLTRLSFDEEPASDIAGAEGDGRNAAESLKGADLVGQQKSGKETSSGVNHVDNSDETQQLFACHLCKAVFNHEDALERHGRRHKQAKKTYGCDLCGIETSSKREHTTHMRTHFDGPPFVCVTCGNQSATLPVFLRHRLQHSINRPFVCNECGSRFLKRYNLIVHMRVHSGERPLTCKECGQSFGSASTLRMHRKRHDNARPLSCDQCSFTTKYLGHLNLHKRLHTGDKLLRCSHAGCSYTTPRRSHLREHEQSHEQRRQYGCPYCGRAYNVKSHLDRHMLVHQLEKRYSCIHCDYSTYRNDRLKNHLRKHERDKQKSAQKTSSPAAENWLSSTGKTASINNLFE